MSSQRKYPEEAARHDGGDYRCFDTAAVANPADGCALLDTLLENTDQAVIGLDRDGRVRLWSEGARRSYGYAYEEVIGRAQFAMLHALGDSEPHALLAAAAEHGRWSGVLKRRCKDGEQANSRVSLIPHRNAGGEVHGYLLLCGDDTREIRLIEELNAELEARAQTEAWLRDNQEHYRLVTETAADAMVAINGDGVIAFANGAAERIFGYELEEMLGREVTLLIPSALHYLRDKVPAPAGSGRERRVICEAMEFSGVHRDGGQIPLEVSFGECRRGGACLFTAVVRHMGERRLADERFRYLAQYDALTELPNRALLHDRIEHTLAVARRNRDHVALLFLDLDDFKLINDTLGHQTGDRLLRSVAQRLRGCMREGDTLGRLGGDEFIICLPAPADGRNASLVADKVMAALREHFYIDDHEIHAGASVGISLFPDDGTDAEALLHAADLAMYTAKKQGRGGYRFYTAMHDMPQRVIVPAHAHRTHINAAPPHHGDA